MIMAGYDNFIANFSKMFELQFTFTVCVNFTDLFQKWLQMLSTIICHSIICNAIFQKSEKNAVTHKLNIFRRNNESCLKLDV